MVFDLEIERFRTRRSYSSSDIYRSASASVTTYPSRIHSKVYTLKRFPSLPSLGSREVQRLDHRPKDLFPIFTPKRYWNIWDEYWWDKRHYLNPTYWPYYYSPGHARRYAFSWNIPQTIWWYNPGTQIYPYYPYARFNYADYLDPLYWRRDRVPANNRIWKPGRKWFYDSYDVNRAVSMYRQNLIDFSELDRHWLSPSYWERRTYSLKHSYYPH